MGVKTMMALKFVLAAIILSSCLAPSHATTCSDSTCAAAADADCLAAAKAVPCKTVSTRSDHDPGAFAKCTACRSECGEHLMIYNWLADGTHDQGTCNHPAAYGEECSAGTWCSEPVGYGAGKNAIKSSPAASEFTCTRTCQPWAAMKIGDVAAATLLEWYPDRTAGQSATALGHNSGNGLFSTIHCDLYKKVTCKLVDGG